MITVSIDIGSTWTKGAAFRLVGSELELVRCAVSATIKKPVGGTAAMTNSN